MIERERDSASTWGKLQKSPRDARQKAAKRGTQHWTCNVPALQTWMESASPISDLISEVSSLADSYTVDWDIFGYIRGCKYFSIGTLSVIFILGHFLQDTTKISPVKFVLCLYNLPACYSVFHPIRKTQVVNHNRILEGVKNHL